MLISQALAATTAATTDAVTVGSDVAATPGAGQSFMWNMGLIALMFAMFYMLLIRPQQKRLKAQQSMVAALKVGDKVITAGGLLGTISKLISDSEVEVDLGGTKVTALRYTLTVRNETPAA